jgi:hypothetical protein
MNEEEANGKNHNQGKRNRAAGARFELKVRKDLEEKGWITDKWTKSVNLETGELVPAKRKFIPGKGFMGIGTGFPDFIAFKPVVGKKEDDFQVYRVIGVESKSNGFLDKKEKEKCSFLLEKGIFKDVLIARKGEKRGAIEYVDFATKEEKGVF